MARHSWACAWFTNSWINFLVELPVGSLSKLLLQLTILLYAYSMEVSKSCRVASGCGQVEDTGLKAGKPCSTTEVLSRHVTARVKDKSEFVLSSTEEIVVPPTSVETSTIYYNNIHIYNSNNNSNNNSTIYNTVQALILWTHICMQSCNCAWTDMVLLIIIINFWVHFMDFFLVD